MPTVTAADGVALHVDTRGDGPLAILAPGLWSPPPVYAGLVDHLARDHRVLTYDPRGHGRSDRRGPYDLATDAADLAAVAAAHGGAATVVGIGAGATLGLHALAAQPDLIGGVVCPSGSPLNRADVDSDSLGASRSVLLLLTELAQRDYRGFLRSIVTSTNPQLDDAGVTERIALVVDYIPHEVFLARASAWLADDAVAISRAAGDRLWILLHAADPWTATNALETTRDLLPGAHVLEVEDGPMSRPDIAAGIVRQVSGVAA